MAAALNGFGVSGVAPDVALVNVRAGQDSGYFFLTPTVNALTYSGDVGLDVVNMSFYVDPWLYNCQGGAPEDSPEQAAEQDVIIETMTRALNYAHRKGVTLVGALGNNHDDLVQPAHRHLQPATTRWRRARPHHRQRHVLRPAGRGPARHRRLVRRSVGRKADYSNWTTDLSSGEIEVAAPGGWFRDGFGTPTYRTNGNLILSTAPLNVLQAERRRRRRRQHHPSG